MEIYGDVKKYVSTGNMLDAMQFRNEVHCAKCGGHLVSFVSSFS